jgi:hypothetical protein
MLKKRVNSGAIRGIRGLVMTAPELPQQVYGDPKKMIYDACND